MSTETAKKSTEIEGMNIGIAKRNIGSSMMSTEIAKKSIETEERNIETARMRNSILKLYI